MKRQLITIKIGNQEIPADLMKQIVDTTIKKCSGYNKIFRCVNLDFKTLILPGNVNLESLMILGAKINNIRLCKLSLNWNTNKIPIVENAAYLSAWYEHIEVCKLIIEYYIQNYKILVVVIEKIQIMLHAAIFKKNINICTLILTMFKNFPDEQIRLSSCILKRGARYGYVELCKLAKKWGANDWNEMFVNGVIGGNVEICELAIEWGADKFTQY